jgi:hypothetical protein
MPNTLALFTKEILLLLPRATPLAPGGTTTILIRQPHFPEQVSVADRAAHGVHTAVSGLAQDGAFGFAGGGSRSGEAGAQACARRTDWDPIPPVSLL